MNLMHKNIMIACGYEAAYGGNFLKMLMALAAQLKNRFYAKVYFVFPKQSEKDWLILLQKQYTVGFTRKPYPKSVNDLCAFLVEWNIDLVHTHFEAYDVPVAKAINRTHRKIEMVWHLHDNLTLDKTGLNCKFIRKVGTHLRFWLQYGWYGRKAYFIGVSAEIAKFVCHYRTHLFSFPTEIYRHAHNEQFIKADVVLNGIDLSRVSGEYKRPTGIFTFLTFGGHTSRKGIPCILDAADELWRQGAKFSLVITNGVGTKEYVENRYGGDFPMT